MPRSDLTIKAILLVIALFLGMIALRPFFDQVPAVYAQAARFDHVTILATTFLYKGQQGLLLLDRRNGNVWFVPRQNDTFKDPVFAIRMQFEKLDQAPQ
jgi:hypothetical protein